MQIEKRLRQQWSALTLLALLFLVTIIIGTSIGTVRVSPSITAGIIWSKLWPWAPSEGYSIPIQSIIWNVRLPRVIMATLVGGSLAVAGTIFQGLLRNPMADPYVLGISSGASLGAVIAFSTTFHLSLPTSQYVPIAAFIGAIIAISIVYLLGNVRGHISILTLLLAGIAVSTVFSAMVSFLIYFSGDKFQPIMYWLMGGLGGSNWNTIRYALPYLIIGTTVALLYSRHLNALVLGEEAAYNLGVNVARVRLILVAAGALLTATAVAFSGIIGFVGLLIPHTLRLLISRDHRLLIPACLFGGGAFLALADTIARTALRSTELPVGIITALAGGPFFIFLLRQRSKA